MSEKQLELGQDNEFLALQDAWESSLEVLKQLINKPSFDSWIKPLKLTAIEQDMAILTANSKFAKDIIERNHIEKIRETLREKLGSQIRVVLQVSEAADEGALQPTRSDLSKAQPRKPDFEPLSLPLNGRYTFESFVIGKTNRLAGACAEAVAQSPGKEMNPLFIYGGVGLGKTHLMQAIGLDVVSRFPDMKVAYVSGEMFTNSFIAAVREHKTEMFRRSLRGVDMWLVDDIQFVTGKERTEEEFFHTYATLYEMGKQIVLTSDRSPKELDLDERLLSRFESGMLTDIKPPDYETRVAIIQRKAQWEEIELPQDIANYIARLITSNIRHLEGALTKLYAHASLLQFPLTLELAHEVLGDYYGDGDSPVIDIQYIQKAISRRFEIDVAELVGVSRSQRFVIPRQIAMYLCRKLTDNSLPAIGEAFGKRDHSTVIHSCNTVEKKMGADAEYAALVEDITHSMDDAKNGG